MGVDRGPRANRVFVSAPYANAVKPRASAGDSSKTTMQGCPYLVIGSSHSDVVTQTRSSAHMNKP